MATTKWQALWFPILVAAGCGGVPDGLQQGVSVAAQAVSAADREAADRYAEAADRARQEAQTLAEYHARMQTLDGIERALRVARSAVLSAQAAIDAWDAGDDGAQWGLVASCLAGALGNLATAFLAAGIDAPGALADAIGLARAWGGSCHE